MKGRVVRHWRTVRHGLCVKIEVETPQGRIFYTLRGVVAKEVRDAFTSEATSPISWATVGHAGSINPATWREAMDNLPTEPRDPQPVLVPGYLWTPGRAPT